MSEREELREKVARVLFNRMATHDRPDQTWEELDEPRRLTLLSNADAVLALPEFALLDGRGDEVEGLDVMPLERRDRMVADVWAFLVKRGYTIHAPVVLAPAVDPTAETREG